MGARPSRQALVSVLVPTYNGARFLDVSLRSAERQSYRNLEVLVRDDGSSDESRDIIRHFCARDRRFRLVDDGGRRLGGTGNMIELLRLASGAYIKYLHQDDRLEPTCVERLVRPLSFDTGMAMATSSRHRIDASGQRVPATPAGYLPLQPVSGKLPGEAVICRMATTQTNQLGEPSVALFRNGLVDPSAAFVLGGFPYSYMNDVALWTNLLQSGDLYWHAAPLSEFRVHDGQRSAQLSESITVGIELAEFACFGYSRGYLRDPADLRWVARNLSTYLAQLHARLSAAAEPEQEALAPRLAIAVAAVRTFLAKSSVTPDPALSR